MTDAEQLADLRERCARIRRGEGTVDDLAVVRRTLEDAKASQEMSEELRKAEARAQYKAWQDSLRRGVAMSSPHAMGRIYQ